MKSVEYWKRRAEARMYEELEKAEDTAGIIAKVYAKAARYLMDKAEHVFDRFKITECLTKEEALSLIGSLSNVEDTEELIRKLEADGSEEALETLKRLRNTGAYGSRIQRLGEMLKQVNKIMTSVYGQELKEVTGVLSEIASDSYLKTIYDLQQRINTGFSVAHIDQKRIDKILRMNWSGEHFSKRIWNNTQKLGQTVKEQILEGALTGKTEREMADEIAQEFGKGAKVARRLVRTESCHVSSEVNAEAYEDADIEMYLYLATLDLRTSEICRNLDGKRFPVSEREVGENYPPMHPWCRSTTIAVVDEEYLQTMKRTYRDPESGRNEKVPLNMNYKDWYRKFVDSSAYPEEEKPTEEERDALTARRKERMAKRNANQNNSETHEQNSISEEELDLLTARRMERMKQMNRNKPEKPVISIDEKPKTVEPKKYDIGNMTQKNAKEINSEGRKMIYGHWEEYRKKFLGNAAPVPENLDNFMYDTVKIGEYKHKETLEKVLTTVDDLSKRFYSPINEIKWFDKMESLFTNSFANVSHRWETGTASLNLNPVKLRPDKISRVTELSKKGYCPNIPKGKELEYVVTHEFGHAILNIEENLPTKKRNFVNADYSSVKKARQELSALWDEYISDLKPATENYEAVAKSVNEKVLFGTGTVTEEEKEKLRETKAILDSIKISRYSLTSSDEFVAEAFANAVLGTNPNEYSMKVYDVIFKYFGKG